MQSRGPCLLSWPILRSGCRFRGSQSQYISQVDAQGSSDRAKENSHQQQGQEERVAERQEAQSPQETLAGETKYAQKKSPTLREGWRLEVWKQAGKGAPKFKVTVIFDICTIFSDYQCNTLVLYRDFYNANSTRIPYQSF